MLIQSLLILALCAPWLIIPAAHADMYVYGDAHENATGEIRLSNFPAGTGYHLLIEENPPVAAAPPAGLLTRHGEVLSPFRLGLSKPIHLSTSSRQTDFKHDLAASIGTVPPPPTDALPFDDAVNAAAIETSLEPALLHAVIAAESHHDTHALSPRGAQGLMQLMPATARRFQVSDPYDPAQNIRAGARYLRELRDLYQGDLRLALAAYNAGPEAVHRYGGRIPPFAETRRYVPKVMQFYRELSLRLM